MCADTPPRRGQHLSGSLSELSLSPSLSLYKARPVTVTAVDGSGAPRDRAIMAYFKFKFKFKFNLLVKLRRFWPQPGPAALRVHLLKLSGWR